MYKAAILYFICYVKMAANWFLPLSNLHYCWRPSAKENRIYIRVEVTGKKCKRPFCCTVFMVQVYFT